MFVKFNHSTLSGGIVYDERQKDNDDHGIRRYCSEKHVDDGNVAKVSACNTQG